ncbi:MAG: nucleoside-diphosphate kinase [Alphaproteobacteria bacterium GM202ARS2]|nr:nucleoside-diphosphate kinase [Alphaproteobacteria bacterium GM202ARS2]
MTDSPSAERTLCIIKPDAIAHQFMEAINESIEAVGLRIVERKELTLTLEQAQAFYAVHKERPFYESLCRFMTSGPICVQLLEGKDAVRAYRKLMGDTNPEKAADNTLRKRFGHSIEANAVHGSDSPENATQEIAFFFAP